MTAPPETAVTTRLALTLAIALLAGGVLWACAGGEVRAVLNAAGAAGAPGVTLVD